MGGKLSKSGGKLSKSSHSLTRCDSCGRRSAKKTKGYYTNPQPATLDGRDDYCAIDDIEIYYGENMSHSAVDNVQSTTAPPRAAEPRISSDQEAHTGLRDSRGDDVLRQSRLANLESQHPTSRPMPHVSPSSDVPTDISYIDDTEPKRLWEEDSPNDQDPPSATTGGETIGSPLLQTPSVSLKSNVTNSTQQLSVCHQLARKLSCVIFGIYHRTDAAGLLKLTMGLLDLGSETQHKELMAKHKDIEFGRKLHEHCHYLYELGGDLKVTLTTRGNEWEIMEEEQIVQYDMVKDGALLLCTFHIETSNHSGRKVFNGTFAIEQGQCPEKITSFTIREPIYLLDRAAYLFRGEDISPIIDRVSTGSTHSGTTHFNTLT